MPNAVMHSRFEAACINVQGRKAKRKVMQEIESAHNEDDVKEDLLAYKQAVLQMKEAPAIPPGGRILDLFKEG